MFEFLIADAVQVQLKGASLRSPAVLERLEELKTNPLGRANPTGIPIIGEFYINAGNRWCILFDIDNANNIISIKGCINSSRLFKILTGRIEH